MLIAAMQTKSTRCRYNLPVHLHFDLETTQGLNIFFSILRFHPFTFVSTF